MSKAERERWRRAERRWTNNELADRIRAASDIIDRGEKAPSRRKRKAK